MLSRPTMLATVRARPAVVPLLVRIKNNVVNFRIQPDPVYISEPPPLICIKVCLPYQYSWQEVHRVLLEAAKACPGILEDPAPEILHLEMQPSYAEYELDAYCHSPTLQAITQLKQCIQDKFHEAGMEMTAPEHVKPHLAYYEESNNKVQALF